MLDPRTALLGALLAVTLAAAGSRAAGAAPAAGGGMQILFLPPPMEGKISLGIFNGARKLVRVLHQAAGLDEFKVGENGLVTRWDGRDSAGQPLPPGKYTARGWMVGDLEVDGVAFHGNDWIKDDSPRYARVTGVENSGRDEVRVTLRTVAGQTETLGWKLSREGVEPPKIEVEAAIEDGRLTVRKDGATQAITLGEGEKAVSAVVGFGGTVWTIVESPTGRDVRAYSAAGEFLRRLGYGKEEPQPRQLAASLWEEQIFLLEENASEQRVRALVLGVPGQPAPKPGATEPQPAGTSTWRVTYLKRVLNSDSFDAVASQLGREKPPKAEAVAKVPGRLNPLLGNQRPEILLTVATDAAGAVLKTTDDLPLVHLTQAGNLKWARLVKEGTALMLFQGDGGVVEEFRIANPGNMMAFDAGEYELRPPGARPSPPKENPAPAPKRSKPLRPGDDL